MDRQSFISFLATGEYTPTMDAAPTPSRRSLPLPDMVNAEDAGFFDGVKAAFNGNPVMPSLADHDRRFHPHGYREGAACKYRDDMEKGDKGDDLSLSGGLQPAQSEHEYRLDPDGTVRPANEEFRRNLAKYDKDHKIYAVSDTHSTGLDDLDIEDAGIVIIGGDFIMRQSELRDPSGKSFSSFSSSQDEKDWLDNTFIPWMESHPDKQFVIIPGNHDKFFQHHRDEVEWPANAHYLVDQPVEVNGLKMYGTPWCYYNMNGAFEVGHKELRDRFSRIPEGLDVLITHTPPKMPGLDVDFGKEHYGHFGSSELTDAILEKKPKLVLCGHVHTGEHKPVKIGDSTVVNVARIGSARHKPGYAGRMLGFSKNGDNQADFLIDETDGQQIDKSAYPEPGSRIKNQVYFDKKTGLIDHRDAWNIVRNAAIAVNGAIDRGDFSPQANTIGLFDYAKQFIDKMPDEGDNVKLKKAVADIDASAKSGWKKLVPKVDSPYDFKYGSSYYGGGSTYKQGSLWGGSGYSWTPKKYYSSHSGQGRSGGNGGSTVESTWGSAFRKPANAPTQPKPKFDKNGPAISSVDIDDIVSNFYKSKAVEDFGSIARP